MLGVLSYRSAIRAQNDIIDAMADLAPPPYDELLKALQKDLRNGDTDSFDLTGLERLRRHRELKEKLNNLCDGLGTSAFEVVHVCPVCVYIAIDLHVADQQLYSQSVQGDSERRNSFYLQRNYQNSS